VLIIARLAPRLPQGKLASPLTTLGLIALLIAPTIWAIVPLASGTDTVDPLAGPPRAVNALTVIAHAFLPESANAQPELIHYLLAHQGQARYLVATVNAPTAAPFILDTGQAALALGGFNGFDTTLTVQQVAAEVAQGKIRFFLLPSFAPALLKTLAPGLRQIFANIVHLPRANNGQLPLPIQPAIIQWVNAHCVVVPRSVAEPGLPGPQESVDLGETYTFPTQLFDCAPQAA